MEGTTARIHLENFRHNIEVLRNISNNRPLCLAVKANAYGHGAIGICTYAETIGIRHFGVSRISEVRELRDAGISADILLFSAPVPEDYPQLFQLNVQPFVTGMEMMKQLAELSRLPKNSNSSLKVHIKVDTGMGRIGCNWKEALEAARYAAQFDNITVQGIATHYPLSDNPQDTLVPRQLAEIEKLRSALAEEGLTPPVFHAANSGGILYHADDNMDMLRPGIAAYGYAPDPAFAENLKKRGIELKPVMELLASVSYVKNIEAGQALSYGHIWQADKPGRVATVNSGYADGYPRITSGQNLVRIHGRDYPQVGRICMDQIMVDLGDPAALTDDASAQVRSGDEAVLFGPDGPETAETIAERAGTVSYEILCAISARVPRVYV